MRNPSRRPRATPALARSVALCVVVALSLAGCWLPIKRVENASPDIVGTVRRADGTPRSGARVGIAPEGGTCAEAATQTSDSAGVVRLPRTEVTRSGVLIIPPIEHFWNVWTLCAGSAGAPVVPVYEGHVDLTGPPAPDTLACLEWSGDDGHPRIACRGRDRADVRTAGHWADSRGEGYYRLILDHAGSRDLTGAYLQWVERRPGGDEIVRATRSLPVADRLLTVRDVGLRERAGGRTCVSLHTAGRVRHWTDRDQPKTDVDLDLGAPGEARPVESCENPNVITVRAP